MSRLRFMRWTMEKVAPSGKEAAAVNTRRKGPISDLQNCQRIELVVHREPYGYEQNAAATIACRRLQWENLLAAVRDHSSWKAQGHSCWKVDGGLDSESGGNDDDCDEAEAIVSDPTSAAEWLTRVRSSHWRLWTGASIRELCFRATGAVDTYLHDMLRLSQANLSVTLLDIRFKAAIQFNLHILLVDFNNFMKPS
ncbi:hypothetical protein DFQ27_000337 [Actinomortierella ambigua]|uniref:Uncharacterized protein n=1 Tax=Actinomortierella ambigua TaxID=1343610 RepID=A0A9P6PL39_9FUNG|nr:hypothetical protein DFQ27_000337 [Actinomortierella ambigua]